MAYMSQEKKKELEPGIKSVLKKYGVTGSIKVEHNSTLHVTLRKGNIDFREYITNKKRIDDKYYMQVNVYCIDDMFTGIAKDFLIELRDVMMIGNYNNSDVMIDYHDVGWYIGINIGVWDKEYILTK